MTATKQLMLNKAALYSLLFLWLFTGLTSIFFSPNLGYEILANAMISGWLADLAVWGGGVLDIVIGLWLLTSKRIKLCCLVQVVVMLVYTALLTIIDASFWLHPFGPLTKNIPIFVLIGYVYVSPIDR